MTLPTVPTVPTIEGTTVEPTDDMYVVILQYVGCGPFWSAIAATRNKADADLHYRRETALGNRAEIIRCTVQERSR